MLTQILYAMVFVFRYLDLFESRSWDVKHGGFGIFWNLCFKLVFLGTSFYLIFLMMKVYPRTRERERAWKFGIYSVIGSLVLAPIMISIFETWPSQWFLEVMDGSPNPNRHMLTQIRSAGHFPSFSSPYACYRSSCFYVKPLSRL